MTKPLSYAKFDDIDTDSEEEEKSQTKKKSSSQIIREIVDERNKEYGPIWWAYLASNEELTERLVAIQIGPYSLFRQYAMTFWEIKQSKMYPNMSNDDLALLARNYGNMIGIGLGPNDTGLPPFQHDCYQMTNKGFLQQLCVILNVLWIVRGQGNKDLSWLIMEYVWHYPETLQKMKDKHTLITDLIFSIDDLLECFKLMVPYELYEEKRDLILKYGTPENLASLIWRCL